MNMLRVYLIIGTVAAIGLGYGFWYHAVYKSGYNACEASVKTATEKQKEIAQKEIAKVGEKYATIHEKLRTSPDYLRPVSPLVGNVIGSMPEPSPSTN